MIGTRPDISYVVTQPAYQSTNPSKDHLEKALYICLYLLGTSYYSLIYNSESGKNLIACTDSGWGQDKITGHLLLRLHTPNIALTDLVVFFLSFTPMPHALLILFISIQYMGMFHFSSILPLPCGCTMSCFHSMAMLDARVYLMPLDTGMF